MADNIEAKFSKVDNEILKLAIVKEYNDTYRKGEVPLKDINWNGLAKLKEGNENLKKAMTNLLIDDAINPSSFKVNKMSIEVGEALKDSFNTNGIDLGVEGKKEQLAKQTITLLNAVYNGAIKEDATSKQVKLIDIIDLFNVKGLDFPNLKNLDTTVRVSKNRIANLSETAIDKLIVLLKEVA